MINPELKGDRCPKCNGSRKSIAEGVFGPGTGMEVSCPECHGTGLVNSPNACKECHGKGSVVVQEVLGKLGMEVSCPRCQGVGLEPQPSKLQ